MTLKRYFIIGITFILLSTANSFSFTISDNKKIYSSKYITNYLYGSILYDDHQHNLAVNNLRKNLKLQGQHSDYDVKYVTSLIIEGKFDFFHRKSRNFAKDKFKSFGKNK